MISGHHLGAVYKRVQNMVRRGKQTAPSIQTGLAGNMQVQKSAFETTSHDAWQTYGFASATPVGTDHALISLSGDNSNQISIATNHTKYRPQNMVDGDSQMHDSSSQFVYLNGANSKIIINAKTEIDININGQMSAVGNKDGWTFFVNGNQIMQITSSGVSIMGSVMATGDVVGNGISLDMHVHPDVMNGGGNTGTAIG